MCHRDNSDDTQSNYLQLKELSDVHQVRWRVRLGVLEHEQNIQVVIEQ